MQAVEPKQLQKVINDCANTVATCYAGVSLASIATLICTSRNFAEKERQAAGSGD